jgi:hypothetical protein
MLAGRCGPAPSCSDGVKNGSETDVDCGGMACHKCFPGKACVTPGDCINHVCAGGLCPLCDPPLCAPTLYSSCCSSNNVCGLVGLSGSICI